MDVTLLIKRRLVELGLDQKDLAQAAQVTESYISQLLARKKAPPAPARTDIYDKMSEFLRLPSGELSTLADLQRQQTLKKKAVQAPGPLFKDCRGLILRKCVVESQAEVRRIFEKEPFGELERLITQTILDAAQGVAREELRSAEWLQSMAQVSGRSFEQVRVAILEFLDTDIFQVSLESCVAFLDPMVESWDIDLKTFCIEVALNRRLTPGGVKRFEFVEQVSEPAAALEPGFEKFLRDETMSGDATEEEILFLRKLHFGERRPNALYYYRELQNLRDPLHFSAASRAE